MQTVDALRLQFMWQSRLKFRAILTAIEASALVHIAFAASKIAPFSQVLGIGAKRLPDAPIDRLDLPDVIRRVRWAVQAAARRAPFRAVCLQQGLAAQAMLRRRGVPAVLHYGAAPHPEKGLQAHVWVTAGGLPVIGVEEAAGFAEVARFPAAGVDAGRETTGRP